MNGVINFVRFIAYSVAAVTVRKGWNWLTADVDPIPGTKEFDKEFYAAKEKYNRLRKKKGENDKASRKIRLYVNSSINITSKDSRRYSQCS